MKIILLFIYIQWGFAMPPLPHGVPKREFPLLLTYPRGPSNHITSTASDSHQDQSSSHQQDSVDPCAICYEVGDLQSIKCNGKHKYHPNCIRMNWINSNKHDCPMCREKLIVHPSRLLDGTDLQNVHESMSHRTSTMAHKGSWKDHEELYEYIKSMPLEELLPLIYRFRILNAPHQDALMDIIHEKLRSGQNWNSNAPLKNYIKSLQVFQLREINTVVDAIKVPELSQMIKGEIIVKERVPRIIRSMSLEELRQLVNEFRNNGMDILGVLQAHGSQSYFNVVNTLHSTAVSADSRYFLANLLVQFREQMIQTGMQVSGLDHYIEGRLGNTQDISERNPSNAHSHNDNFGEEIFPHNLYHESQDVVTFYMMQLRARNNIRRVLRSLGVSRSRIESFLEAREVKILMAVLWNQLTLTILFILIFFTVSTAIRTQIDQMDSVIDDLLINAN